MTKVDSAPAFVRLTSFGYLHGVYKDTQGRWMMSVRTEAGEWLEVPHDGKEGPRTSNTKQKRN